MEMLARITCRHKLQSLILNTKKTFFFQFPTRYCFQLGANSFYVLFSDFSNVQLSTASNSGGQQLLCSVLGLFCPTITAYLTTATISFTQIWWKTTFQQSISRTHFPRGGMGRGTPGYFGIERKRAKIISHFHYKIKLYTERVDIYICEKLHQMSYSRLEVAIYINIYTLLCV